MNFDEKPIDHKKKIVLESIEDYENTIKFYNKIIAENKKQWLRPDISEEKRHAHKSLIEIAEREKQNCQKEIKRLLNE